MKCHAAAVATISTQIDAVQSATGVPNTAACANMRAKTMIRCALLPYKRRVFVASHYFVVVLIFACYLLSGEQR